MSSSKPRKRASARVAQTKGGEPIKLVCPIPGGMARWYAPGELTPRRSREYELIAAEMQPLVEKAIEARVITVEDGEVREFAGDTGPAVTLTRHELRAFMELTDAATWAHLKDWTLDRPLPADMDELLDLPRPLYEALTQHGAKLLAAKGADFALPADAESMDEVDEDSPS